MVFLRSIYQQMKLEKNLILQTSNLFCTIATFIETEGLDINPRTSFHRKLIGNKCQFVIIGTDKKEKI